MKKLLFLIAVLAASLAVNAAKPKYGVESVQTTSSGDKTIISKKILVYSNWSNGASARMKTILITLDGKPHVFQHLVFFLEEGDISILKDSRLLLKLNNDEVITLYASASVSTQQDEFGLYRAAPSYPISEEDLAKIIANSVVKVRIETETKNIDREVKNDTFSAGIKETLPLMLAELADNKSKEDIYSDF